MVFLTKKLRSTAFAIMLVGINLAVLVVHEAQAASQFRVYFAADTDPAIKQAIEEGISRASAAQDSQIFVHQAPNAAGDQAFLQDVLDQPAEGVLLILDGLNGARDWIVDAAQAQNPSLPMIGLGIAPSGASLLLIGAEIQDYTDLVAMKLQNSAGALLCLYAEQQALCESLQKTMGGRVEMQKVSGQEAASMQMALTVSAMTKNPQITDILLTDARILPNVAQALQVIRGEYTVGVITKGNVGAEVLRMSDNNFALDPQWALQAFLALSVLQEQAATGQVLSDSIKVRPRLLKLR